jgi:hypothetical protein
MGLFAVILLSAAIIPSATIRVQPERITQTIWITLRIDPKQSDNGIVNSLPVQVVSVPVAADARILTTGYRNVPDQRAEGLVLFTNLISEAITIPAGTGVRSSQVGDVRFKTIEAADLEPFVGSIAEVPVQSNLAGEVGNLEAGMIDSIEGELGLSIQASNPEAIQGGASSRVPAVVQKDLDHLQKTVQSELLDFAEHEIANTLREDQRLLHQSLQMEQTLESTFDRAVGDLAESVGLQQHATVSGWVYNTTELETLLKSIATERLPANSLVIPQTFRIIEVDEAISTSGDPGRLRIRIQQQWTTNVSEGEVIQRLRGVAVEDVDQIVDQDLGMTGQIELDVRPHWFPLLPLLTSRYAFILEGF